VLEARFVASITNLDRLPHALFLRRSGGTSSRISAVCNVIPIKSWFLLLESARCVLFLGCFLRSLFFCDPGGHFPDNALLLWLFCFSAFAVCFICCISGCFSSLRVVDVAAARTRGECFVTRKRCACIEEARAPLRSREKRGKDMTACLLGEIVAYSWD
jgi:hypothetical protein